MPKKLLRWIINWVAPAALKKVAVKMIPSELGKMLMATRQEATLEADVSATCHCCSTIAVILFLQFKRETHVWLMVHSPVQAEQCAIVRT
jgi:Ni,Fe-hydrogenase III component G